MIRSLLAFAVLALPDVMMADDFTTPPESWRKAFRDEMQAVWDRLRKDDGKVTADEVIEENYKGGSHHDGDRQLATAFSLIQLPDDPIPSLRRMMGEEKAERRAFAVLVAGLLGDARLRPDIERLERDVASLGQFQGDWSWDTVGDAAKEAVKTLGRGGIAAQWIANGGNVARWVEPPKLKAEAVPSDEHKPSIDVSSPGPTAPADAH